MTTTQKQPGRYIYDEDTGVLTYRMSAGSTRGLLFRAHRVIHKIVRGVSPGYMDRRDVDRSDSRPSNLRDATVFEILGALAAPLVVELHSGLAEAV